MLAVAHHLEFLKFPIFANTGSIKCEITDSYNIVCQSFNPLMIYGQKSILDI